MSELLIGRISSLFLLPHADRVNKIISILSEYKFECLHKNIKYVENWTICDNCNQRLIVKDGEWVNATSKDA